jgi:hypothetical protein
MQFNCDACNKIYPKQENKRLAHQKRLGCDGSVNPNLVYMPNYAMAGRPRILYYKCIGNFFSFSAMGLIRLISKFQDNIFPYDGAFYEQPAKFVESMQLIDNLLSEHKESQAQALKRAKR